MNPILLSNHIYSVSGLTAEARIVIENNFDKIWIVGEISNLSKPSSGHVYFSLKDEKSQVRCAFFRMTQRNLSFIPENGQQVLLMAQVSLYETRGDFQLIVQEMQPFGDGALQLAFEKCKQQLAKEGLFDEKHKKPIPEYPKCLGVITSATGAAIHDILKVLRRRFQSLPVIIYSTLVQGSEAAPQIINAIQIANQRQECDVLILARGGGSLEDLWPFNEESVARAIFASGIPIVTGIGHEVDFTIADFVADHRAPTPSAAAELVSPDQQKYLQLCHHFLLNMIKTLGQQFKQHQQQLHHLQKRLRHPGERLREQTQQLDQLEMRFYHVWKSQHQQRYSPLQQAYWHLYQQMQKHLTHHSERVIKISSTLDGLSPLKTLERGYAILMKENDNRVICRIQDVKNQETIRARITDGTLTCQITDIQSY